MKKLKKLIFDEAAAVVAKYTGALGQLECVLWYTKIDSNMFITHCVKSVHIPSFPGPYLPLFGLNAER